MLNVLRGSQDYTNAAVDRDNFQGDPDQILFDITNSGRVEHFVGGLTTTHTADGLGLTTRLTLGLDYTTAFNQQNFPFDHVLQPRGLRNLNEWEHRTLTFDLGTTWDHEISGTLLVILLGTRRLLQRLGSHRPTAAREDFGARGYKDAAPPPSLSHDKSSEDLLKVVNAGFFAQEVSAYASIPTPVSGRWQQRLRTGPGTSGLSQGECLVRPFRCRILELRLVAGDEAARRLGTVRQGTGRL